MRRRELSKESLAVGRGLDCDRVGLLKEDGAVERGLGIEAELSIET